MMSCHHFFSSSQAEADATRGTRVPMVQPPKFLMAGGGTSTPMMLPPPKFLLSGCAYFFNDVSESVSSFLHLQPITDGAPALPLPEPKPAFNCCINDWKRNWCSSSIPNKYTRYVLLPSTKLHYKSKSFNQLRKSKAVLPTLPVHIITGMNTIIMFINESTINVPTSLSILDYSLHCKIC